MKMKLASDSIFLTSINFYVSVMFCMSFGIFMTTMVLRVSHMPNPMIDAVIPNGDTYPDQ